MTQKQIRNMKWKKTDFTHSQLKSLDKRKISSNTSVTCTFPGSLVNLCSLSLKDGNVQNQVTKNCVLTDYPLQNLFSLEYECKMFTVFTELWNENFSLIHQLENWKSPLHCTQKLNMFHMGISLKIKNVRARTHFGRYNIYFSITHTKKIHPFTCSKVCFILTWQLASQHWPFSCRCRQYSSFSSLRFCSNVATSSYFRADLKFNIISYNALSIHLSNEELERFCLTLLALYSCEWYSSVESSDLRNQTSGQLVGPSPY